MARPLCRRCKKFAQFYPTGLCLRCTTEVAERRGENWNKMGESESRDLSDRLFPDVFDPPPGGIVLETTKMTPAASDAFTPEELDARIAAHRKRVLREMPKSDRGNLGTEDVTED